MLIFVRLCCSRPNVNNAVTSTTGKLRLTLQHLFGKYLFITNSLTCGVLMAAGDVIQQRIEQSNNQSNYNWERTGRMLTVGLAVGPPQHVFYSALDRFVPWRSFRSICLKIFLDQVIASPMCLSIFFFGMGYLEGQPFKDVADEFKRKFPQVYLVDCTVWPPSQFINFYFVPAKYRVGYINFLTMLYNVFLSFMHHDVD